MDFTTWISHHEVSGFNSEHDEVLRPIRQTGIASVVAINTRHTKPFRQTQLAQALRTIRSKRLAALYGGNMAS